MARFSQRRQSWTRRPTNVKVSMVLYFSWFLHSLFKIGNSSDELFSWSPKYFCSVLDVVLHFMLTSMIRKHTVLFPNFWMSLHTFQAASGFHSLPKCMKNQFALTWDLHRSGNPSPWTWTVNVSTFLFVKLFMLLQWHGSQKCKLICSVCTALQCNDNINLTKTKADYDGLRNSSRFGNSANRWGKLVSDWVMGKHSKMRNTRSRFEKLGKGIWSLLLFVINLGRLFWALGEEEFNIFRNTLQFCMG